jgi:hypothetical protein
VLSVILTASVLFPDATTDKVILGILVGGGAAATIVALVIMAWSRNGERAAANSGDAAQTALADRNTWRMPPLASLPPMKLSLAAKTWMGALRLYLVIAVCLVAFRIAMLAIGNG